MGATHVNCRGIEWEVEYTYEKGTHDTYEAQGTPSIVFVTSIGYNDEEFIDLLSCIVKQEIEDLILEKIEG